MQNPEIALSHIAHTPVFTVNSTSPVWKRAFGATFYAPKAQWLFPAYEPFLSNVLHDLPKVHPEVSLSADARAWVDSYPTLEAKRAELQNITLPVKSYQHQLDGLAELLTRYRWGLQWGMGTGKTKVVVDAINLLRLKTLVLAPKVAIDNWVEEIRIHSGDQLSAVAFKATSRAKKLDLLTQLAKYDVIITTYDTAKLYGVPMLFPETLALFQKGIGQKTLSTPMRRLLSSVNHKDMQAQLAQDWLSNRKKPRHIQDEITKYTANRAQWLQEIPYRMVVADESHRIARRDSIRTKICSQLAEKAARRYLLTGTMVSGDPGQLFPQLKFLAPYLMPEDWHKFQQTYYVFGEPNAYSRWSDKIVTGYRRLHVLNARVRSVTSERHLDDCVDLPARKFETIYFELSTAQKQDYNYIVNNQAMVIPGEDETKALKNRATQNTKLLQICSGFMYVPIKNTACDNCAYMRKCAVDGVAPGSKNCARHTTVSKVTRKTLQYGKNPKLDLLTSKLKDALLTGKAIVWGVYKAELDLIEHVLKQNQWGYVRVDGDTTDKLQELAGRFNNDDDCRVYLAHIKTGIAVTLNAARYMFFYSRNFSTDDRDQALHRNYRIGQKEKTVVYDLCARKSLEVQQKKALQNKNEISELLLRRVDCAVCSHYERCLQADILPWSTGCLLGKEKKRVIMQARCV